MRPPKHGKEVTQQDVTHLMRILRRVSTDLKRPEKDRKQMEAHLTALITLLVNGQRTEASSKTL